MDKNPAENAIRPFVIERKGRLFSATPADAPPMPSALVYSLVVTVKADGPESYTWLRPEDCTFEQFEALLPVICMPAIHSHRTL